MSSFMTRQRSREGNSEGKDSETLSSMMANVVVDSNEDDRPSFCLNEEQRKMKTFHERKTDVDSAIEWIVKEIVSTNSSSNIRLRDNLVLHVKEE